MNFLRKVQSNKLFNDSFWALLGSILGKGLSLIGGIIVANLLAKDLYGEYGLIKTTLLYMAVFSTLGLGFSATRFIALFKEENQNDIYTLVHASIVITMITSGIMALALLIFANEIAIFINSPSIAPVLRLSSIAIIFNAIDTLQIGIMSGFKAFKQNARNNIYAGIINFFASCLLTYFYCLYGAVIAIILSYLTSCVLNHISIRKILREYTKHIKNYRKVLSELFIFSLPIALQESLYTVTHWFTSAIFVKYAGFGEMALSSAAGQWQAIILFIPGILRNVTLSHFSSSLNDTSNHQHTLNVMLKVNFLSTFIPFIIISILSKWVSMLYGPTFNGLPIVLLLSMLVAIANCLSNVYSQELISRGENWMLFIVRLVKDLMIMIVLFIVLRYSSQDGAVKNCIIALIFQTLYLATLYIKVKRDLKLS